ncbi:MAG TPA: glycogen debranching enzyme N-terminal domain-containing protein, partial [Thermoanaerobaculia bacterium]
MLIIDREALRDLGRSASLEWIDVNGLGGWASSSISFANTRRYHGMLVTASRSRADRQVIVSKLDETLNGVELSTNFFPGVVHPRGFEELTGFERGAFPVWQFGRLRKTVVCPHGENTTIIRYEIFNDSAELRLRPFLAGRDYHCLMRKHDSAPPNVRIVVPGARFEAAPDWFYNFEYPRERERGLDDAEDLFTPGSYVVRIEPGTPLDVILTTEENVRGTIEKERARRERLDVLHLAADQFIIDRDHHDAGIVAGYHWFAEWGRDSLISLPGLCLATGRYGDAKRILRRWMRISRDGR